jgi:ABC-type glutathione transport system ATPase component
MAPLMAPKERSPMPEPLLIVGDLVVEYPAKGARRRPFRALAGVSIDIRPGETVGLVGESGSGKSTLGRAVLGLAPVTSGSIKFSGREIGHRSRSERRALSSEIQVVFQDPYSSLNPSLTIERTLTEPLLVQRVPKKEAAARVRTLLDQVKLPRDTLSRLPREFSGGQRQRIAIARALALSPKLIVCDEPVSALDLSTQARVLDLFQEIQEATGVAYLFVSHDLTVVRHLSHRVAVMYGGEIVEYGEGSQVTASPVHSYTQRLLLASPVPDPARQEKRRLERRALLAAASQEQAAGAS